MLLELRCLRWDTAPAPGIAGTQAADRPVATLQSTHAARLSPTPSPLSLANYTAIKRQLLRAQYRLRLLVESSAFNAVFLGAILVNTVLLAIEHDGMSKE